MSKQPEPPFFWGVVFPSLAVWAFTLAVIVIFTFDLPLFYAIKANNIQVEPLGNSSAGQIGTSTLYLTGSIVATFLLAAVVVRKKLAGRKWVAVAMIFGVITFFVSIGVFWYLPLIPLIALTGAAWGMFMISVASTDEPTTKHRLARLPFVMLLTIGSGITFVLVLPFYSLIALPIIYSIWDIVAVFKGPMLKVATGLPSKMKPLFMVRFGARVIGYGDLMFYALMVALGLTFGIAAAASASSGIFLGVYVTSALLSTGEHKALPGLPLPILLGFIGMAIGLLI